MRTARFLSQGRSVDFLHGGIFGPMLRFALPVFISSIFQQFYNLADTMIVANYLGDEALAAIGATASIYDLLVGFAIGLSGGLAVVTARSYGAGDLEQVKRSVAYALVIGAAVSLGITLLAQWLLSPLLLALNTPADILEQAYSYISAITLFTFVMFAYNLLSGLLRAIGDSVMPLVFLIFSSLVNVVLDIEFITRFSMGIAGAAYATVISQGLSAALCVVYLWKKAPLLLPQKRHFRYERGLFGEALGQGLSMAFMHSVVSAGTVILQYGINGFGTLIIAGHTTARKIYVLFVMPFSALSQAVTTFVSQNRGACQWGRIRKALRYAYLSDLVLAGVVTVFLLFFAEPIVRLVSGSESPEVISNATLYLHVVGPAYFMLGALLNSRSSLQAIGSKLLPLISSFTELVVKLLFVVLLIPHLGYFAVIICEPIIWTIMTIQMVIALYGNQSMREARGSAE